MKLSMKRLVALVLVMACVFAACSTPGHEDAKAYTYEEAVAELSSKLKAVDQSELKAPLHIYDLETETKALADINTFGLTVRGSGQIDIEIAAPSELSGDAPDDWINVVAKKFNAAHVEVGGKTASVSVRKISSGEVVTYITEGDYRPDVYIPSSDALGKMLDAKGIGTIMLTDRIAGNVAGILMKKEIHDTFAEKYGEATVDRVLEASLAGDLVLSYTNPYSSATG